MAQKRKARKKKARKYGKHVRAAALSISSLHARSKKAAGRKVKRAMHEMKRGKLKSGRSGKKVKSRKQAIATGLSEARRAGGKVPRPKKRRSTKSR